MTADYKSLLKSGLQQMQIELPTTAIEKLQAYIELIAKWSEVYNLTTNRAPEQIVTQHILDSLTALPFLDGVTTLVDVGTGAGLPGIPLAIARPDISVKLLDSQQKKINFVQHVVTSLQLTNVLPILGRVESLPVDTGVDMVISRAFASLELFVNSIAKLCSSNTKILAMKGRLELVQEEQAKLPAQFKVVNINQVFVPGLDAQRCLVFLTKQED